jgi:FixJ family two-component response regulator
LPDRKPLIAVVDDDESIRKSLKRLLTGSGFDVNTFESGYRFLASIPAQRPDCIVLDMHMPDLNGLELQAHLMQDEQMIPILFITAHDDAGLRTRALAAGAVGYLDKPVRKDVLLASLNKAVGDKKPK